MSVLRLILPDSKCEMHASGAMENTYDSIWREGMDILNLWHLLKLHNKSPDGISGV